VLEHPAVGAVGQQVQPAANLQVVAGQAAVAAQQLHGQHVAMKGAPGRGAAREGMAAVGEQLQQHGLANQVVGIEVGLGAQGQHVHVEGLVGFGCQGLVHAHALGHQHLVAQGRVQAQQPGVLVDACAQQLVEQRLDRGVRSAAHGVLDARKVGHACVPGECGGVWADAGLRETGPTLTQLEPRVRAFPS